MVVRLTGRQIFAVNGTALPVLGANTVGLLGSPLRQGPFLAVSALIPGRANGTAPARHDRGAEPGHSTSEMI